MRASSAFHSLSIICNEPMPCRQHFAVFFCFLFVIIHSSAHAIPVSLFIDISSFQLQLFVLQEMTIRASCSLSVPLLVDSQVCRVAPGPISACGSYLEYISQNHDHGLIQTNCHQLSLKLINSTRVHCDLMTKDGEKIYSRPSNLTPRPDL